MAPDRYPGSNSDGRRVVMKWQGRNAPTGQGQMSMCANGSVWESGPCVAPGACNGVLVDGRIVPVNSEAIRVK